MQTHMAQLTKQRLSDFFVKEDGHVAHKNALVAGTVASGAILASLMFTPDVAACEYNCGDQGDTCHVSQICCSATDGGGDIFFYCRSPQVGC